MITEVVTAAAGKSSPLPRRRPKQRLDDTATTKINNCFDNIEVVRLFG